MSEGASGLLVVDKPSLWSSHDVVARLRGLCGTRRVGHAGTLDPLATGVLVVGVNRGTRLLSFLVGVDKEYEATIRLGQASTSDDAAGQVSAVAPAGALTVEAVQAAVAEFTGDILQVPSSVSAVKVQGQRAYAAARAGRPLALAPRPVTVSRFELLDMRSGGEVLDVQVRIECSSGTFVRALARDVGRSLGVGGHITALRRTRVGPFTLQQAQTMDTLVSGPSLMGLGRAAAAVMESRVVSGEQERDLGFGRQVEQPVGAALRWAALSPAGELVAIVEAGAGEARARSVCVFVPSGGARA